MHHELQPLRQALSHQLKADLCPIVAGLDPNKLLQTYLDRLTMYIGVDVADQTYRQVVVDNPLLTAGRIPGYGVQRQSAQCKSSWNQC